MVGQLSCRVLTKRYSPPRSSVAGQHETILLNFRKVYQIVRKLADEQSQYDGNQTVRLSIPAVYEKIKKSNSSLNRKSKRLLEDSIERVLGVLKEEDGSSDEMGSIDGEFDGIEISESKVSPWVITIPVETRATSTRSISDPPTGLQWIEQIPHWYVG